MLWGELLGCTDRDAIVQNYMVGLGGGDVRPQHLVEILDDILDRTVSGPPVFKEVG